MKNFFDSVMDGIRDAVSRCKSLNSFAGSADMSQATISRWLDGSRPNPRLREISKVIDYLGGRIVFPHEELGDVDMNVIKKLNDAKMEIERLREERAILRGEIQALEKQIARLAPTPTQGSLIELENKKMAG